MKLYYWLAWGGFALAVVITLAAIALVFVPLPGQPITPVDALTELTSVVVAPLLALVGAAIAVNRRENSIGWLLILIGLINATSTFLTQYAQIAFWTGVETLPGGLFAAWASNWLGFVNLLGLILLLHLFPTGTFLTRRWRRVGGVSILIFLGVVFFIALPLTLQVTTAKGTLEMASPVGGYEFSTAEWYLVGAAVIVVLLAALSSMIARFRRAAGVEREQIKWFLYAATLFVISIIITIFFNAPVFQLLQNIVGMGGPIAIGIAVLRYRLFDIDILIRRTVTYSVVTVMLLVTFFASVILLQRLFTVVAAPQQNDLVTVLSTLAIAALFVPVRNRVQAVIDRRFNRKKYDAQKILEQFAVTVRDETDLEKLSNELLNVVGETMQPRNVSLWLKGAHGRK